MIHRPSLKLDFGASLLPKGCACQQKLTRASFSEADCEHSPPRAMSPGGCDTYAVQLSKTGSPIPAQARGLRFRESWGSLASVPAHGPGLGCWVCPQLGECVTSFSLSGDFLLDRSLQCQPPSCPPAEGLTPPFPHSGYCSSVLPQAALEMSSSQSRLVSPQSSSPHHPQKGTVHRVPLALIPCLMCLPFFSFYSSQFKSEGKYKQQDGGGPVTCGSL